MQQVVAGPPSPDHATHHHAPQSPWPPAVGLGLGGMALGLVTSFSFPGPGRAILLVSFAVTLVSTVLWWRNVSTEFIEGRTAPEALPHEHAASVLTPGMIFFIASEVMFFAAFFAFYFYTRFRLGHFLPPEWTAGSLTAADPSAWWGAVPAVRPDLDRLVPSINTAVLVTSGVTYTLAHHALGRGHRGQVKLWLIATIALGIGFLFGQRHEWAELAQHGITLGSGLLGSAFYMLTGFHGAHVMVGVTWLSVLLLRVFLGHFDARHQFAFRAGGWYWHFVDVVWILLFTVIYVWV